MTKKIKESKIKESKIKESKIKESNIENMKVLPLVKLIMATTNYDELLEVTSAHNIKHDPELHILKLKKVITNWINSQES